MALRKIFLHGALTEVFGTEPIELDIDSPKLLFSGLNCVLPNFDEELRKFSHFELATVNTATNTCIQLSEESFDMSFGSADQIHLFPKVEGDGFVIAGYILGAAAVGTMAYYALGFAISMAISYAMSAIMRSLAPSPESGGAAAAEKQSFIFTQATNVSAPGHPVPLVYGECKCGSITISVGATTEQML